MDIKELNKTQLILLTLLITFVVSIATGIVTVTLMQQMPKSATQTINNIIQRTIEKVSTVPLDTTTDVKDTSVVFGDGESVISIYPSDGDVTDQVVIKEDGKPETPKALGQGIILSDVGLVMVDSSILTDKEVYKVTLEKKNFDATILKKFPNGFTILKISQKKPATLPVDPAVPPVVDSKQ